MIPRLLGPQIRAELFKGKILVLYGARQVGKTTLLKKIQAEHLGSSIFLNCDEPDIRLALSGRTSTELHRFVGNNRLVIIDEAQRVPDIGFTLKLMIDTFPDIQIVASGSSSFELADHLSEPLTGRKTEYILYPISLAEHVAWRGEIETKRLLETFLVFGMYPRTLLGGIDEARRTIEELSQSYLYKDILSYGSVRKPEILEKLLQALALQVGNEVSYTELATLVGVGKETIERYIELLEKTFVLFRLRPLSRNPRKEIAKSRKVYFYDLGVLNSVIKNFNPPELRNDIGALWENFVILERMKHNSYRRYDANSFFWRTYDKKEVDYIEEREGKFSAVEIKWGNRSQTNKKQFMKQYPNASFEIVNKTNILSFAS